MACNRPALAEGAGQAARLSLERYKSELQAEEKLEAVRPVMEQPGKPPSEAVMDNYLSTNVGLLRGAGQPMTEWQAFNSGAPAGEKQTLRLRPPRSTQL